MHSPYYDEQAVQREVAAGRHREAIGGLWDALGELQLRFLKDQGLQPRHKLLDVGCGALRFGVKAVDCVDPGNYFGVDLSASLIEAGYMRELSESQRAKLPRSHLHSSPDFDLSFLPGKVDFAMAQSLFTHMPLNHIRRCLSQLAPKLDNGGVLFATAWLVPDDWDMATPFTQPGTLDGDPIISFDVRDPYHYKLQDFQYIVTGLPYRLRLLGDWGHPRGQPMLAFERV